MFALDARDRSLLRRVQLDPASDAWSPWERFGGPAGAVPTPGRNTDGRLEVFSLAPGGAHLHHRAQRPDGGWHDREVFGGPAGAAPAVGVGAGGRLEAFALAPGGTGIVTASRARLAGALKGAVGARRLLRERRQRFPGGAGTGRGLPYGGRAGAKALARGAGPSLFGDG
ncbi:hypothetical protein ACWC4E_06000 [Streptomyces sp. NPDC001273]|uniref:hypothetical protein n=1 Tax=unclassified Streptomyces TaxID=2593676 RepID=UPI0033D5044E